MDVASHIVSYAEFSVLRQQLGLRIRYVGADPEALRDCETGTHSDGTITGTRDARVLQFMLKLDW